MWFAADSIVPFWCRKSTDETRTHEWEVGFNRTLVALKVLPGIRPGVDEEDSIVPLWCSPPSRSMDNLTLAKTDPPLTLQEHTEDVVAEAESVLARLHTHVKTRLAPAHVREQPPTPWVGLLRRTEDALSGRARQ